MNIITLTAPPAEPVELDPDVYDHLRLTPIGDPPTHPHDAILRRYVVTARIEAENITKRAFVEQTLRLIVDRFPCADAYLGGRFWGRSSLGRRGYVELLRPPLIGVDSVSYYDTDNTIQTLDADNYFVTDDLVPRLCFIDGFSAPDTYGRPDALRVEYRVGYPSEGSPPDYAANVPEEIKSAILIGVELLYNKLTPDERESRECARENLLAGKAVTTL